MSSDDPEPEVSRLMDNSIGGAQMGGAHDGVMATPPRSPRVAIIGAGMSGICMAIALRRAGISDLTIFEKAQGVGGTWRENTYPGLTCDVPSRFYQFSFAPNPDWSHLFSPGAEIRDYFTAVAHDFGLQDSIRFGTEVVRAEFAENHWRGLTPAGDIGEVDFLIAPTRVLHHLRFPRC